MLELLAYDFMQRSLLAAALVGAVCSVIGVFVVLRGLAFAGAGTAHAAFAGVTLAYLLGLPPLSLAIVFGLTTVWITGWVEEKGRMKLDVSIGILYTATMALAILFLGLMKTYNPEVYGYLFGSVLSVTTEELMTIGGSAWWCWERSYYSRRNCISSPSTRRWRQRRRPRAANLLPSPDSRGTHCGHCAEDGRSDSRVCDDSDPRIYRVPAHAQPDPDDALLHAHRYLLRRKRRAALLCL
jgi:hypothetical protein